MAVTSSVFHSDATSLLSGSSGFGADCMYITWFELGVVSGHGQEVYAWAGVVRVVNRERG